MTFTDKASGGDTKRPQLDAMLAFVRNGDTVVVHSMDRLAQNLDDLRRHPGAVPADLLLPRTCRDPDCVSAPSRGGTLKNASDRGMTGLPATFISKASRFPVSS
ncbi:MULTISPECIES: recombinase family protein [Cupriavidus]